MLEMISHSLHNHPRNECLSCVITKERSLAGLICRSIIYTAISRKVVRKNVHATIPKGNMGYDQYTVPDTVAFERTFVAFL